MATSTSMPPASYPPPRHPLGLPAGSVRAILILTIVGLIWLLTLMPRDKVPTVPLYLYYVLFLCLGSFFSAHGHSIAGAGLLGTRSPLYLPRGTLRALIVLGFLAILGWKYYTTRDWNAVLGDLKLPEIEPKDAVLPVVLLGAFFAGVILSRIFGRSRGEVRIAPPWFQDILAWLALIDTLLLGVAVIVYAVINPGLSPERRIEWPPYEMFLGAVTCLYFGARS